MIKIVIFAATAVVLLAASVFLFPNRVLIERHYTQAETNQPNGYAWYNPTEVIAGGHTDFFQVVPVGFRTVSSDAIEAARDYAVRNRSESLLIWHRGALQFSEYWMGLGPGDVVNSRSMHKMVGGLLIARAIADGYIASVDDTVAQYIPQWRDTAKNTITIRNVLQMSSGLRWFSIRDQPPFGLSSRRYLDPYWDDILLDEIPMSFKPGTEYDYSDTTADVMPHIIQGATGKRYSEYLSEALIKPLQAQGGFIWVNRMGGMPHGGCCLMLPPETWLRFGIFLLHGGRWNGEQFLPDSWRAEMLKPSANKEQFGMMIWLGHPYLERRLYHRPESPINQVPKPGVYNSEPFLADDIFMFDGAEGRMVYIVPSEDLVIVRTGFRPAPDASEWDNTFLPNTIMRGIKQIDAEPANELSQIP
ncbi:MAG: serine hydrolase [Rhodospirillaceae bacterium]|jgi:CubicO group peptidase (beta-lactamase class C family)|nr:serine hydrolase [Rhodospirillaceae bacterium]